MPAVALEGSTLPTPPRPKAIALRIELLDVTPLVWRRVLVPNQWTLTSLHRYLQWVMGWTDSHAHEFQVGEDVVAPDWWIREIGGDTDARHYRDERRVSVAAVVSELGAGGEFEYRYDMGDGWQHRLVVERPPRLAETQDLSLPVCLAGENACPPEDVGGPHGYAEFLEMLGDPAHEQHEDMVRWIGGVFDPKGFDLNRLNREFGAKKRRR
jgi:Plasmid pRiA4b ORF-3-like protein